jgi:dihydrofolate reductase
MRITLIAAVAENRVIGRGNALPWHLPADLARFKRRTEGHVVIMGRRTFESVGQPLPHRRSIVVTRKHDYHPVGVEIAHSLDEAIERGRETEREEIFILGGAEIYALALPDVDRMELTIVHAEVPGDTFFPECDLSEWTLIEDERHEADDRHAHAFSFRIYERTQR